MNYINDREIDRLTGSVGEALMKEPRLELTIPDREGSGRPWEGGINGYFFRIPRGVPVKVPKSVAELIAAGEQVAFYAERSTRAYRTAKGKKLS